MNYVYDYITNLIDSARASNTSSPCFDMITAAFDDDIYVIPCEPKPIKVAFENGNEIKVNSGNVVFHPKVTDVSTVNDKVTIVTFADGSQEKAVCRDGDHFSVETGVTICLMKKMLQTMCGGTGKSGTNLYNNMVKEALKKRDAFKIKKEEAAKKEKEKRAAKQKAREIERNKKRDNRDFLIDMLTEALKRADCTCGKKKQTAKE